MVCTSVGLSIAGFEGNLFIGGLAAQLLDQGALDAQQAGDGLEQVHRDADGARLLGDRAVDGLADPPGGIGAELEARGAGSNLLTARSRPEVAFLDQVQERDAAPQVAFGNTDHQAQVGADDGCVGFVGAARGCIPTSRAQVRFRRAGFSKRVRWAGKSWCVFE